MDCGSEKIIAMTKNVCVNVRNLQDVTYFAIDSICGEVCLWRAGSAKVCVPLVLVGGQE